MKHQDALITKLCMVFDASSKGKGSQPSLNECVYVGPSMVPAIFDILLRFRAYKMGLVADIEKAFLNIRVKEEQRDSMRFLWVRNLEDEDLEIIVFRFKTVLFGMSCSPFCLNATLDYHIKHFYKENMEKAEKILRGFYIDDWTCGGADTEEAFELFKEVKTCTAYHSAPDSSPDSSPVSKTCLYCLKCVKMKITGYKISYFRSFLFNYTQ